MSLMPMKKRGSVAIKTGENSWTGLFKTDGALPVTFGEDLWEILQENWKCLVSWGKELLRYGDWEDYLRQGQCPYCGKFGLGQPFKAHIDIVNRYQQGELAPDIEMKKHSHIPPMPCVLSQNAKSDGLWLEWIYVVDPKTYNLEVFKSVRAEGTTTISNKGRKWGQPNYRYVSVGLFNLHGQEPDWESVQDKGYKMSGYYHDKYSECQIANFLDL